MGVLFATMMGTVIAPVTGPPTTASASPKLSPQCAAIVAKNIFLPNVPEEEQPEQPEPATNDGPRPSTRADLHLTGLMFDGTAYVALLEDKVDRRSIQLGVGDEVGPWRVEQIEMTRLVLRNKDGTVRSVLLGEGVAAAWAPLEADVAGPPGTATMTASPEKPLPARLRSTLERLRERARRERAQLE